MANLEASPTKVIIERINDILPTFDSPFRSIKEKRGFNPSMLDRLSIVFNIAVQVVSVSFKD